MPEKKRYRYKLIKWIASIFFIVFAVLAGIAWYLNIKSKPAITQEIKSLIYKSTDSLYTISFSNVTTNILTGHASLQNVKISADTNRFKQLIALKRAPNNLYQVSLKKLIIKNFHPLRIYRERKLNIDEVLFDKPDVLMINKQFDFNENRPPRPIKSPYTFINKILKEFSIQTIRFKDASFKYIDKNLEKAPVFSVNDLNITLTDLLVDSTSALDPGRLYLLKDVLINLKDYTYPTPDKMYNIQLSQLDFRASTGKLRIKKFAVVPLYDEMAFGKVAGYTKDRFDIQMSDILLNGINLPLYVKKQELSAKDMTIANGFISVFNNNSLPRLEKGNRMGRFPHQLLQKLGSPVLIEKILLKDVNVIYAIYNKRSDERGRVSFEHTTGTITNVTNVDKIKSSRPIMEAHLNTYLMGQGKMDVNFKFNLNATDGAFSYSGALQGTNARILNQITRPLGLVKINRGYVEKLEFNFDANDSISKGKVNFRYYDLSLALMRNDKEKGHLVKRGLLSFLANALIINSENPSRDGKFTSATVNYLRPANTSFFGLIWKSLYMGIKYSIGITEEKQIEIKQHIAKFKEIRASREKRKIKRLERRKQREREENEKR